ncbi:MAG: tetratricopeptide repeat protein, partial [Muribaculaceae bacterium]|nr:tetratricopeptide repeat protein [Muribaculaceae bacterium]
AQVNAEQVLNIGRNVLSMEDYMLSIQYFNQAIKAKPYLSDPYFFRALAKLYLEDYKGAEEDCTLALERNKFKTESYKVRGFARQNMGKDSLAIIDYDAGLQYNPEDKYFLFYKALAQTELKQKDEAEATFQQLLRLYPQFEDGYSARGRMRVMSGDTVGAIADLNRSVEISKNHVNARLLRAGIAADQKRWADALEDMDAAIKLKPQDADLYINRAYLRYNKDDYFGAMSDYNYTLELEPYNTAALFNRALLRYEVKDLNRAADDLKKVLQYEPDNFHARYNLGLINMERGNHKEALSDLDIITQKYPRFYPAYYAKAEVYRDMGNMRVAMQQAHTGDELVSRYVANPEKNPLDRPAIAHGKTRTAQEEYDEDESEIEVMNRFNQLVTVGSAGEETHLTYNEKIKGRVQDRDLRVEPEPSYALSLMDSPISLQSASNYFRELDDFNQRRYITDHIYLSSGARPMNEKDMQNLFNRADYYEGVVRDGVARGADLLALGVIRMMLKDYT